ncbi:helix-turn-helix domain-containing protein [Collimonas pratensis]|uniref:Helix-turn-helix domain protein n=1 Tax=Collimonas pratensis TaxID=279113 RepID=A0A127Q9C4_9BURK|nr:helix-turn-helix domain-containing protein [Collimonas pratensis]AMP06669.1 helix-turn-helix domain protein [Collimonas pratensis]
MTQTAETLFKSLQQMPSQEREKFFSLIARRAFSNGDNLSHAELFGHLQDSEFTADEAAEYLGVSIATFRRYCKQGKVAVSSIVGTSYLYPLATLRELKRALHIVK